MFLQSFDARLLYSVGKHPAGSQVRLRPGEWTRDGMEYELVGTPYLLREHEFERVRRPRSVLDLNQPPARSA